MWCGTTLAFQNKIPMCVARADLHGVNTHTWPTSATKVLSLARGSPCTQVSGHHACLPTSLPLSPQHTWGSKKPSCVKRGLASIHGHSLALWPGLVTTVAVRCSSEEVQGGPFSRKASPAVLIPGTRLPLAYQPCPAGPNGPSHTLQSPLPSRPG